MANSETTPPGPSDPGQFSLRRRSVALPTLISVSLAVVFIAFLLTRFDIDLGESWRQVRASTPGFLALAVVLYYLTFPLRGLRWRILLRNANVYGDRPRVPSVLEHSSLVVISWFANSVTWFRLGDAYRAFLLSSRWQLSFSRTAGTMLAERGLDIAVVAALLLAAGIGLLQGDTATRAGAVIVAASALAVLALVALLAMRLYGLRIARLLPQRMQAAYQRFQEGTLGSFRRLPLLVLVSALIWFLEAGRLYFVIKALGLEISLAMVLFAALAHSLLTTIPVTPGGLGFVEAGLTGLLVLVLPREDAATITLLDRSITYASILAVGGLVFAVRQWFEAHRRASGPIEKPARPALPG